MMTGPSVAIAFFSIGAIPCDPVGGADHQARDAEGFGIYGIIDRPDIDARQVAVLLHLLDRNHVVDAVGSDHVSDMCLEPDRGFKLQRRHPRLGDDAMGQAIVQARMEGCPGASSSTAPSSWGAVEHGRSLGLIDVAADEPELYKDSQPVLGPSDNTRLVRGCCNTAFRSGLGGVGDLAVRVDNIQDVIEASNGCICHNALFELAANCTTHFLGGSSPIFSSTGKAAGEAR